MKATYLSVFGIAAVMVPALALAEGPAKLYPKVEVRLGHDDNTTMSDRNEISSGYVKIKPALKAEMKGRARTITVDANADVARYFSSSSDNYEDAGLNAKAEMKLSNNTDVSAGASIKRGHDPRGSADYGVGSAPEQWNQAGVNGFAGYTASSKLRFEGVAGYTDKSYRSKTVGRLQDNDATNVGATMFVKLMPKTSALIEGRYKATDYDTNDLDNGTKTGFVGLTWAATAKTAGSVRLGYAKKDFDAARRQDFSGTSWEVNVDWEPRERSKFNFSTYSYPSDSTGLGDAIDNTEYTVGWQHKWNERLSHDISATIADRDYRGVRRNDDERFLNVGGSYELQKGWTVNGKVQLSDRQSTVRSNDYDRMIYSVGIAGEF